MFLKEFHSGKCQLDMSSMVSVELYLELHSCLWCLLFLSTNLYSPSGSRYSSYTTSTPGSELEYAMEH